MTSPGARARGGRALAPAVLAAVLLMAACDGSKKEPAAPPATGASARRPNVLLIVLDTTRADRCSFLGYGRPTTPYLEELARSGTAYTNCWSPSSWTGPAHASLFTGLRPENHGYLRDNRPFLDASAETLAERFKAAGYATCGVSNNPNVGRGNALDQGFDTWHDLWRGERRPVVHSDAPGGGYGLPEELEVVSFPPSSKGHGIAAEWARERHAKKEPFFLFVNDMEPHLPYEPAEDVQARFVREGTDAAEVTWARLFRFPVFVGHNFGLYRVRDDRIALLGDLYDAEIATLDRQLRTFVEGLREGGVLDDTVVVVVGDHGENLGEHGLLDHQLSLHRTLLHVPLLVVAPGHVAAGARVEDLVRVEDVAPTLLEIAGLTQPVRADGRSLLHDVPGRRTWAALDRMTDFQVQEVRALFPQAEIGRALVGLRSYADADLHYVRAHDGREELYDLRADPREDHDLAPAGGDLLDRARRALEEVHPRRR